jgi:exodeoxyribonuclease V gamma subunit
MARRANVAIHLHRSNRAEALVEALCQVLRDALPADPFLQFPVVVGSRGMERWLRHEVATRIDIAAGLAFPFPRQALAGAARWLLAGAAEEGMAAFWKLDPSAKQEAQRWERDALAFQLIGLLRSHIRDADFGSIARYLAERNGDAAQRAVTARELLFAGEVADVLDRLMHDRPQIALDWADDPAKAETNHRWLATLLADLGASTDPHSPAVVHRELIAARPRACATARLMCIFGLSTMGPGDRQRLAAIARSIDVHLFVLVPTDRWFRNQRTRGEARATRRAAKTDAELRQAEAELASDNPLLVSLGAPSRDLQAWLEQVEYHGDQLQAEDPATGDASTLLHRLQSWILAAAGPDAVSEPWKLDPSDTSISAHSTYGALRQCEVLRDELLGMFADDPTLEPRDVVVMTPDIETYAPLVAAVFSRTGLGQDAAQRAGGRPLPPIPVSIADLGLRRTNPVAEVLLKTLEVAGERLSASWVLDFLALEPVRRMWRLDDEDLGDIRQLVRDSGLRWGADAADRAAVGQPALDQNTARFALERLALGVLMPDETALGVVPDLFGSLEPAVPLEVQSRDRVNRVGRFAGMLRALCAHRAAMAEPATLATWRERMVTALDELAATVEKSGWLRAEVDSCLDDLARGGEPLGELPVERSAVLRWLQDGFEIPQRGDRPITGAVQICALEPMRSVPFRVVALIGMDDKAFPRGGRSRTWDPMDQREPGERDRREIDRHLMLEAIVSARERLLFLWSGHDVQQGKDQPAAVPVEELLETLGRLTGRTRAELVREHALQPWSAGNFGDEPMSFDQGMAQAAVRLWEIQSGKVPATTLGLAASGTDALPAETTLPDTLELDDLGNALLSPHKLLLRDRLGLSVSYEEAAVEDREPLELDHLEGWSLRARMLAELMREPKRATDPTLVEALRARVAGEGILPLRAGGRTILRTEMERARCVLTHLRDVDGECSEGLVLSVELDDGLKLVGGVADVVARGDELLLQWATPSCDANERLLLVAWLHLLAAIANGHAVVGARVVGYGSPSSSKRAGGDFLVFGGTAEDARTALQGLADVWRLARQRPIALFRKTSYAAAGALCQFDDDPSARGARTKLADSVAQGWEGGYHTRGDIDDSWVATFFVDYDPMDDLDDESPWSLIDLARRVWLPIHRALRLGKDLGPCWRAEVKG